MPRAGGKLGHRRQFQGLQAAVIVVAAQLQCLLQPVNVGVQALDSDVVVAPAIAQGIKELKMVTSWSREKMTGLQTSA